MVKVAKKRFNKKSYENAESSEESFGEFDPKDPFKDDEIEAFNNQSDKILLNNLSKKKNKFNEVSDEEEVLAFDDDESDEDDDEAGSDIEDEEDDEEQHEDVDNIEEELMKKSWGSKKSSYYYGNKIENDEDAELEEEEAKLMQAKMLKQLDASDFGLDSFKPAKSQKETAKLEEDEVEDVEKIVNNLTQMSKSEKLDFLRQESPELFELVREFNVKVKELQEVLLPIYRLIDDNALPHSVAADYILNKMKLNLMYCCHLSFYFVLKSQRISVENHPIVKNILQFRNLSKQVVPLDEHLQEEIEFILKTVKNGQKIKMNKSAGKAKKRVKFGSDQKPAKRDSFRDLKFDDELMDGTDDEDEKKALGGQETDEAHIKRAINYEMDKNKGLTPKRNKLCRNPRVKHREKFRKAMIKRKSIVPKVRFEDKRYSGEASGIRSTVVRSVKIK